MKNRFKHILHSKSGKSFPLIVAVALALLMILCGITEYMRLNIIVQTAIISTVNDNYDDVYHGVREGYSGDHQPNDSSFEESLDYGEIYDRLDNLLGLSRSSGYHVKYTSDGHEEYKLSSFPWRSQTRRWHHPIPNTRKGSSPAPLSGWRCRRAGVFYHQAEQYLGAVRGQPVGADLWADDRPQGHDRD